MTWINGHKAQDWAAVVSARGTAKQAYWMGYQPTDKLAYVWNNDATKHGIGRDQLKFHKTLGH